MTGCTATAPVVEPPPFTRPAYRLDDGRIEAVRDADGLALATALAAMSPWSTLGYRCDDLARYLLRADPALHRFRVRRADTDVGVLCVRYPWLRGPYIELVAIFPQHQGQGLGADLLHWLAAQASAEVNLWALVSVFNAAARRFYARHGFREIGPISDLVRPGCAEILLRKITSPRDP